MDLTLPDGGTCEEAQKLLSTPSTGEGDPEVIKACDDSLQSWCKNVESILNVMFLLLRLALSVCNNMCVFQEVDDLGSVSDDCGPYTELEFWRRRLSKLNTVAECLKRDPYKTIIAAAHQCRQPSAKKWKALSAKVFLDADFNASCLSVFSVRRCVSRDARQRHVFIYSEQTFGVTVLWNSLRRSEIPSRLATKPQRHAQCCEILWKQ